jgi:hypothetical protein
MFETLVGAATIASGFAAMATLILVVVDRFRKPPQKTEETR